MAKRRLPLAPGTNWWRFCVRKRIHLPVDSDLCLSSFQWAAELLGETPRRLRVSEDEDHAWKIGDVVIDVDPTLKKWSWILEGETREVYSDGA